MKRKLFFGLGTIIVGALTLAAVANGPYYALPAWAQNLVCASMSNCPRFIVLADWNSEAVLDRETGIVWERSPATTAEPNWGAARFECSFRSIGRRKSWRLPSVHELASLIDASVPFPTLKLPPGHPFTNVQLGYISDTSDATNTNNAWRVSIQDGSISASDKQFGGFVWCVRGAMNADTY